ncbi:hypothetical protein os1_26100 [Comamonadaceae bacterium OS-1]|nr:hypothetical protein os1_26100 [Comamonadaceae bacterium OS-1]
MTHPLVSFSSHVSRARKAAALLALACGLAAGAAQAQDVYINGTVGGAIAPGVYGQITFGGRPPPPVLYAQPMLIQRGPIAEPPLYLYVPPGHSKNWRRYCGRYNACGRPVYFVQVNERNRWWAQPHGGLRPDHDRRGDWGDRGDGPRHGRGHDDYGRGNDRNDHGRDDRGPGRGHGHRQFDN